MSPGFETSHYCLNDTKFVFPCTCVNALCISKVMSNISFVLVTVLSNVITSMKYSAVEQIWSS